MVSTLAGKNVQSTHDLLKGVGLLDPHQALRRYQAAIKAIFQHWYDSGHYTFEPQQVEIYKSYLLSSIAVREADQRKLPIGQRRASEADLEQQRIEIRAINTDSAQELMKRTSLEFLLGL